VPVFDDFASNGPFFTARWQSEDINGGISEDGWGDTMAAAPDNLLLVLTGKADDVDRRQRLRAAKNAQIRARAEADVRDADIEAEPSR
jgi:glucose/arabinose dehydrogenase